MDNNKTQLISDGRIFTGQSAVQLGLIDSIGNIKEAKEYLKKCGINAKIKMFKNCEHRIPVEGSSLGLAFLKKNLL